MDHIDQIMRQMDEEGRIVFQGTLMAGYSPRQALYNAFGQCLRGDEIDTLPRIHQADIRPNYLDERINDIFMSLPDQEIEDAFWHMCDERN